MLCNEFIDKFLYYMSLPNPRLQNDIIRLHIQMELQDADLFSLIEELIMIIPEYKYCWKNVESRKIENNNIIQISNMEQYRVFYNYISNKGLFSNDEIEWFDDAIHNVLIS